MTDGPDELARSTRSSSGRPAYVSARLNWKRRDPLLGARACGSTGSTSRSWCPTGGYGGCTSWVDVEGLPDDPEPVASEPADQRRELRGAATADRAAAGSRVRRRRRLTSGAGRPRPDRRVRPVSRDCGPRPACRARTGELLGRHQLVDRRRDRRVVHVEVVDGLGALVAEVSEPLKRPGRSHRRGSVSTAPNGRHGTHAGVVPRRVSAAPSVRSGRAVR